MRIHDFWKHWQISENPFCAEEASDDPVFMRLLSEDFTHPDFAKIYGTPQFPTSAIVFGEKGSGKTALRLSMEQHYASHNERSEDGKVWVVRYDDLNASLDTFAGRFRDRKPLRRFRLEDHQDAMLSRAVTQLVDSLMGEGEPNAQFEGVKRTMRRIEKPKLLGLCLLAALYDQPGTGLFEKRFRKLRSMAKIHTPNKIEAAGTVAFLVLAAIAVWLGETLGLSPWLSSMLGWAGLGGALLLAGWLLFERTGLQWAAWRMRREIRTVAHTTNELARRLRLIGYKRSAGIPLPMPGDHDARYGLSHFLLSILEEFGYSGMVVLVDRVDEPAMINGDAQKMKELVWPLLNNKFLQQQHIGIKLLLPIELRYIVHRETEEFFMKARLDKQCMIDRLAWSGSALYDLVNMRLRVCRAQDADPESGLTLKDFFDDEVGLQDVVDALAQMQQPRDAFKLLYQVVQEHCSNAPNEQPAWKIPRLTLMQVTKMQTLRLGELQRGLQPA